MNTMEKFLTKPYKTRGAIEEAFKKEFPGSSFHKQWMKDIQEPHKNLVDLLPKLYNIYRLWYLSDATLSVKLSQIRKLIKKHNPSAYTQSTYSGVFNLPKEERKELRDTAEEKVKQSNNELIEVNAMEIKDSVMKLVKDFSKTKDQSKMAVLLMLSSGMRPSDLFKNTLEERSKHVVQFGNLSKDREDRIVSRRVLFMTAKTFISLVHTLRLQYKTGLYDSLGQLNSHILASFNKQCKKYELVRCAHLRKLYVILSYKMWVEPKMNFNIYIQGVLGHTSVTTSFNYSILHIDDVETLKKISIRF